MRVPFWRGGPAYRRQRRVVKGLEVAVGDDGDSEGGVLVAVPGDAAGG